MLDYRQCNSFHSLRLYKEHCNVNCRNVNVWNWLPAHVVNSDSVAVFKHGVLT